MGFVSVFKPRKSRGFFVANGRHDGAERCGKKRSEGTNQRRKPGQNRSCSTHTASATGKGPNRHACFAPRNASAPAPRRAMDGASLAPAGAVFMRRGVQPYAGGGERFGACFGAQGVFLTKKEPRPSRAARSRLLSPALPGFSGAKIVSFCV